MKKFLKRLAILFSLVLIALALLVIFLPPAYSPAPKVTAVFQPVESAFGEKKSFNILLLGVDYNYDSKAQRYTSGARSDTILVLRVEPLGKELSMLSIPRDLMVGIGENAVHGYDRINAAFSVGGEKLTMETVERITGLKIDHYIVVKSDIVADLVDAIGGVPIKVEQQMDWDDNWAGLHIHLKPGEQRLSGKDAVGYCRFRHDEEGDFGRIKRQQEFLGALLKELKRPEHLSQINELAGIVAAKMKTSLKSEQIVGLATIYRSFPLDNIRKGRPEVEDYFANGAAYLVLAPGEPHSIVKELFPPLLDASVRELSVIIEADDTFTPQAKRVAKILRHRGFQAVRIRKVESSESRESKLVFRSKDGKGTAVLRQIFPQLKLISETAKGHAEVTLQIHSDIFVSEEA